MDHIQVCLNRCLVILLELITDRTYTSNSCVQVISLLMNSASIFNLSEVELETSNNTMWAINCRPDFLIYLGR